MILQGNSYRIPLKDESVHCAISSFPYFGLRSYNLPPTIWGGDSSCRHIWESVTKHRSNGGPQVEQTKYGKATSVSNAQQDTISQFCQLCQAWKGCFGLEPTIALHVSNAVAVCREIKRVLRRDGTLYLNYGDSYATGKNGRSAADTKAVGKDDRTFRDKPFSITELPAKNLCGIPWRVALALQEDGWILRSEIPWLKKNSMPSSVTDRPGTAHEHVFMLVKSARYYYDGFAVRKRTGNEAAINEYEGIKKNGTWHSGGSEMGAGALKTQPRITHPAGRALRTSDPFFDSLDAYIAHLQDVRDHGGMLLDSEGFFDGAQNVTPAALVVNTQSYKFAHYATFPPKLIAPLIQTTPEKCCPECGAPWKRVIEKQSTGRGDTSRTNNDGYINGKSTARSLAEKRQAYREMGMEGPPPPKTIGWQPTCKHIELQPIPAVILDPFTGSGTVGAVARELGRRFIGIDLSAQYLTENALPRSEKKMSLKALGQLPMFAKIDEAP